MVEVRSKAQGIVVKREIVSMPFFHVFSPVEECSEVRFSQLCKLLFLRLLLRFLRFCFPLLLCSE